jgi:uncharacterized membrane protein
MDNIAAMIETPSTISILLGLFFGVLVSLVAYLGKALSRSGALAAAILGTVVFGLGGIPAAVVLLTFFISSSILSVLFRKHKYGLNGKHAKGSRRDAGQVLANGGISGIMIILWVLFPNQEWLWWAFCASLDRDGYFIAQPTSADHHRRPGGDGNFRRYHSSWDIGLTGRSTRCSAGGILPP